MNINLDSLAVGITWVAGIVTIALALIDHQQGQPFDLFYIPKEARLANLVFTALWAIFFLSMMFVQLSVLPDQAIEIAGIAAILGTSLMSIYFRLARRLHSAL